MGPDTFWWNGMWIFPPVMALLFIVCIVLFFFLFFRGDQSCGHHREIRDETALEILKKRYAKGEITKKEFQEMKRDIEESS